MELLYGNAMTSHLTDFLERKLNSVIVARACRAFMKEAEKDPMSRLILNSDMSSIQPLMFASIVSKRYNPSANQKLVSLQKVILKRASVIGVLGTDYQRSQLNGVAFISAVIEDGYVLTLLNGQIVDLRETATDEAVVRFAKPVHLHQDMMLLGLTDEYLKLVEAVGTTILSPTLHLEEVSIPVANNAHFNLLWQEKDSEVNWNSKFKTVNDAFTRWVAAFPNEDKLNYFSGKMLNEYMNQLLRMKFATHNN